MGFVALNDRIDDFALAQRTITLQAPEGIDTRCFFYFLMSQTMQNLVFLNATGTAAKGVKGAKLRNFPIPFPRLEEQKEIATRIERAFKKILEVENRVVSMESMLTQLDQSILSKAFRGELVPQDPSDEPASELLARIRDRQADATIPEKSTNKAPRKTTTKRKVAMSKSRLDDNGDH